MMDREARDDRVKLAAIARQTIDPRILLEVSADEDNSNGKNGTEYLFFVELRAIAVEHRVRAVEVGVAINVPGTFMATHWRTALSRWAR
jgi:hypothetical protein